MSAETDDQPGQKADTPPTDATDWGAKGVQYAFHADMRALKWDYVKSGILLALIVSMWIVSEFGSTGWYVGLVIALVLAGYLGNTVFRHAVRLEMDEFGVTAGLRNLLNKESGIIRKRRRLQWDQLSDFRLRYFSRKPEAAQTGWMMVQLFGRDQNGGEIKITFDGDHEGFKPVLHRAWQAARQRGLPLDEATLANMQATGIETAEGDPWTS